MNCNYGMSSPPPPPRPTAEKPLVTHEHVLTIKTRHISLEGNWSGATLCQKKCLNIFFNIRYLTNIMITMNIFFNIRYLTNIMITGYTPSHDYQTESFWSNLAIHSDIYVLRTHDSEGKKRDHHSLVLATFISNDEGWCLIWLVYSAVTDIESEWRGREWDIDEYGAYPFLALKRCALHDRVASAA